MKIQLGKFYKTRNNAIVKIIKRRSEYWKNYPFVAFVIDLEHYTGPKMNMVVGIDFTVSETGKWGKNKVNEFDLVEEAGTWDYMNPNRSQGWQKIV